MHVYKVRARKDRRGFDLISDVLLFGRLWYDTPDNAIGYAMHSSRSHDAAIRVYDEGYACVGSARGSSTGQRSSGGANLKALETLHKAQRQLQHDVNEIRRSD